MMQQTLEHLVLSRWDNTVTQYAVLDNQPLSVINSKAFIHKEAFFTYGCTEMYQDLLFSTETLLDSR